MIVTKQKFLAQVKLRTEAVPIAPEQELLVRQPRAAEWDEFDFDGEHFRARLVCQFAVDEKGVRLFADTDLTLLLALPADRIELVAAKILDLAGASRRALEALAKNLPKTPSNPSSSGSPDTSASPAA